MPVSVVIPAHNEANVIGRCLDALTRGAAPGELEVVVVCNGCTDHTAQIARTFPYTTVIETDVPSKSNALNMGDRTATGYPRFYVDADVVMPLESLRQTARVLDSDDRIMAAAPRIEFDLSGRPWTVRAFHTIWSRLPYCRNGMVGSGAYGVSRQGRRRFGAFPQMTADDAFVRLHFRPDERKTVETCSFTVKTPASLSGVIQIKTRAHFGNYELEQNAPQLFDNEGERHSRALLKVAADPRLWPSLAVYLYVRLVTRLKAYRRYYFGNHRHWERDDSSRRIELTAASEH